MAAFICSVTDKVISAGKLTYGHCWRCIFCSGVSKYIQVSSIVRALDNIRPTPNYISTCTLWGQHDVGRESQLHENFIPCIRFVLAIVKHNVLSIHFTIIGTRESRVIRTSKLAHQPIRARQKEPHANNLCYCCWLPPLY